MPDFRICRWIELAPPDRDGLVADLDRIRNVAREQSQNIGVQIVDVHPVFDRMHAHFVGGSVGKAPAHSAAGERDQPGVDVRDRPEHRGRDLAGGARLGVPGEFDRGDAVHLRAGAGDEPVERTEDPEKG